MTDPSHAPRASSGPDAAGVSELGPDSVGRWLVGTVGSRHVFDLDRFNYQCQPGDGRGNFAYDGEVQSLGHIDDWPTVGECFFLWFDDLAQPHLLEHWRRSSTVQRISPIPPSLDGQR